MDELEHGHHPAEIAARLSGGPTITYLRDWVYGGIDGAVTTFAIVAGVAGADLSARVVLILGVANLLADGFSMAAGNYSGTKAEVDDYERLRQMEDRHISEVPEGEKEEVRQIFKAKGFEEDDLERVVEVLTATRERWIETMLVEEHGLPKTLRKPLFAASATFAAFVLCGAVPLLPYMLGLSVSLPLSLTLTAAMFLAIGSLKSRWSPWPWWVSALETLSIGLAAAGLAYAVGYGLGSL